MKKTSIYALAIVTALSAAPAFAAGSDVRSGGTDPNAPLAAQLQAAQRGVMPTFGGDARATPPAQEGRATGQSGMGAAPSSNSGARIVPYPNSERPPFDGGH